MRLLIFLFFLSACHPQKEQTSTIGPTAAEQVQNAYAGDLAALQAAADQESGWPSSTDCDATLWAGEALAGGDKLVKLELADNSETGVVSRNVAGGCTPASRDMALGYAYGKWTIGDLAALRRLADYGENHDWQMSEDADKSLIDPLSRGVLGRAIKALSHGADARPYAENPFACVALSKDFEQHLQVLLMLWTEESYDVLEGEMPAPGLLDLPAICVDTFKDLVAQHPEDALFQAALGIYTGNFSEAIRLLLDHSYVCPSYVRGAPTYCLVHRLFTEQTIMKHTKG